MAGGPDADLLLWLRAVFLVMMRWVWIVHPDCGSPEGKSMSILLCGVGLAVPGSPPMTSRTASGTKLLDGLEEHHCKVGVLLASQQDAPPACLTTEHPIKEVSSMSFPGRARVGGC